MHALVDVIGKFNAYSQHACMCVHAILFPIWLIMPCLN